MSNRYFCALMLVACMAVSAAAADYSGYLKLSFHVLSSFKCSDSFTGPGGRRVVIPPSLQKLSGRNVAVEGFLVPLQVSEGVVTSFALCPDRGYCCYGVTPNINQVILCQVRAGQHCTVQRDLPMRVCGTLHVGANFSQGELLSIYQMVVDSTEELSQP